MARDTSSIVKQSRREGYALHPKAHKALVKRSTIPGQHGQGMRMGSKPSQYAVQLREKLSLFCPLVGCNEESATFCF